MFALEAASEWKPWVLMPCRALEAFRRTIPSFVTDGAGGTRLNALSGIGGVQTASVGILIALGGILCLNALSGIGGVQTASGNGLQSGTASRS